MARVNLFSGVDGADFQSCRRSMQANRESSITRISLRLPWQTDTSISTKSWGYVDNDTFRGPDLVLHQLIDIVSKNGNLLLNIGPKSDGTIPKKLNMYCAKWVAGCR